LSEAAAQPQIGIVPLFRSNANFRNLFFSRLVSLFGDWFNLLAILALLRALGDTSATSFAGVLVVKSLPAFVAPMAGVLVDRLPRRQLMMGADALRTLIVLGMLSLVWVPSLPLLYTLIVLQTLLGSLFEPARNALLPDLVEPRALTAANAASAASWSLMLAIGSALGGLFTDAFGWQAALLLDASTYVGSVIFLAHIADPPPMERAPIGTGGLADWLGIRDLIEGVRFMLGRPRVWTLALVKPIWQVTGARVLVLTLLGEGVFLVHGWPLLAVSVLFVARGIGTGVGPFLSRWLTRSDPAAMERALIPAFVVAGLFYVVAGLAPSLWIAAPAIILAHLGGATIWVFSAIRLQQILPSRVRGRVFASEHAGLTLVLAGATGVFGPLADAMPEWLDGTALVWVDASGDAGFATARWLMVSLGVLTFLPLGLWILRGMWLGWGGPMESMD